MLAFASMYIGLIPLQIKRCPKRDKNNYGYDLRLIPLQNTRYPKLSKKYIGRNISLIPL